MESNIAYWKYRSSRNSPITDVDLPTIIDVGASRLRRRNHAPRLWIELVAVSSKDKLISHRWCLLAPVSKNGGQVIESVQRFAHLRLHTIPSRHAQTHKRKTNNRHRRLKVSAILRAISPPSKRPGNTHACTLTLLPFATRSSIVFLGEQKQGRL